ncbi:division/cell wall cluster transcriptional repressor MraZ [Ruminococcus albus]|uniref:division/cell wall cluster transcriptional repressor MraZ n=1 Tax=Ruminococcus albus TaxID=1264 RepID=UPI0004B2F949|nr:division/cell wall cluster transcriptional repressor MraZ [Ruminococcus albus]
MALKTLMGTYNQSMDVKGRMSFPAKFREIIGECFIVTRGIDHCLLVFSPEDFDRLNEKFREMPLASGRDIIRFFTGSAIEAEADKQGRILVPQPLRDWAGLEKEVIVMGLTDRCEIWDKCRWEERSAKLDDEALLAALEGVGI